MSEDLFLEMYALCGSLPGPTSTELSFAMGALKQGVTGEEEEEKRVEGDMQLEQGVDGEEEEKGRKGRGCAP